MRKKLTWLVIILTTLSTIEAIKYIYFRKYIDSFELWTILLTVPYLISILILRAKYSDPGYINHRVYKFNFICSILIIGTIIFRNCI